MNKFRTIALLIAFAPLAGVADEPASLDPASESAVALLKSSLPSIYGFKVDLVRMTDAGVACIKYRVGNDHNGESPGLAVVEGETVLVAKYNNTKFEKAWNSKCAKSGSTK